MKLMLERSGAVGIGICMCPPSDMTGWAREFSLWFGPWVVTLKVWGTK